MWKPSVLAVGLLLVANALVVAPAGFWRFEDGRVGETAVAVVSEANTAAKPESFTIEAFVKVAMVSP